MLGGAMNPSLDDMRLNPGKRKREEDKPTETKTEGRRVGDVR